MKVLGICGSPRKGGNTDIVLEKALEGARSGGADTEKIIISELDISPIRVEEYERVNEQGLSVTEDDLNSLIRKIQSADALIMASPVFFGSLSTQSKMVIDRFQCVWLSKTLRDKEIFPNPIKGAFICVAATQREDFFDNARSIIRHFFATSNVKYTKELFCPKCEDKGDILRHEDLIEKAFSLGKELAGE
ncbi:MAG: hypothetical protein GF409_04730 [Candidatus Omnitrophica bacterium]|nr:hypothetical protein [Candidatus Omnitrophota bacterium]